MSDTQVKDLARRQLDRRLDQIRDVAPIMRQSKGGWISILRMALGMTQADLARRMGVSRQAISQLEQREADGSATLRALEEAADAMGSEVVYALLPERSIADTLEERAMRLARRMTGSVRHTMRLEDQEPQSDLDQRTRELAKELLSDPTRLWTDLDGK